MTLAFRLFGNVFAKEVLILVILMLPASFSIFGLLGGTLPLAAWMAFGIFLGAIQAFVFTVLTIAYVGQAVQGDH
jgi:F-type H+-transporting ATPase subunit a